MLLYWTMAFTQTKSNIDEYVKGKRWYWYVPLWVIGAYCFFVIIQFEFDKPLPFILFIPQAFDFFLHEMAHIVTAFLPPVITASAGSLSEILLGTLLVFGAFKQRSYFAGLVCLLWFMLACQSAGAYMADARAQHMQLVSLGGALSGSDKALHDRHFVLGQLHIINLDTVICTTVRGIGDVAGLFGLVFTAWLIYKIAQNN